MNESDALYQHDARHAVTTLQRISITSAVVVALALSSWLSISPGWPRVLAPLNFVLLLPCFLLGDGGFFVAIAVVPACFCLWCWPVLLGRTTLPVRSIVLLVCSVALSALWLIFGWHYGIEYEGLGYTVGVATINVLCWAILAGLAVLARRRSTFAWNLGFHAALFAWLAWCAFPYLGEF